MRAFVLLPLVALAVACSAPPAPVPAVPPAPPAPSDGPAWFSDVTERTGVRATCRTGEEADRFTILESLGSGVALFDFDADGRLDAFVAGGGFFGPKGEPRGHPCRLYRNLGGLKFEDVTARAGLELDWWYTHGTAVADFDRDGFADLVVTGFGRTELFRNEPDGTGGRKFVAVGAKLGLTDNSWGTSAGWGDTDGDGFPDLYLCRYCDWAPGNDPVCPGQGANVPRDVCPPQKFKPLVHALFRNEGGTRFRDAAKEHNFAAAGCGLGVVLADLNGDRRPDVYVANDAANNFLFWNRGGKLAEGGLVAGVAVDDTGRYNGSMGVDAAAFDGTGRASLWVTNFQGELPALYQNLGSERFDFRSRRLGIGAAGTSRVGFGTAFADLDGDGREDIVAVNGHVLRYPSGSAQKQLPLLFRNENGTGFADVTPRGGPYFRAPAVARGLAVGDLDNDGRPDLVVTHANAPVAVLRNEGTGAWVGFRLAGKGNRDAVGSTVVLETAAGTQTRFVKGGGSYLSANDSRALFGLGTGGAVTRVRVFWSWGAEQSWDGIEPGAYWELTEGAAAPRRLAP